MKRLLFLLVPLLALGAMSTGCASAFSVATVGAGTAHLSLVETSKFSDQVLCGHPTAPPKCLPAAERKAIAKVLDPAFGWDATLLEQLAQWTDGPIPQIIADLRAQITKAINDALAALKQTDGIDKLAVKIGAQK